jgi:hypothetical protein
MTLDNQYGHESTPVAIPELLTAKGVGAILGISVKTVHKLVREKKLACVQVTSRDRRWFRVLSTEDDALARLRDSNPIRGAALP